MEIQTCTKNISFLDEDKPRLVRSGTERYHNAMGDRGYLYFERHNEKWRDINKTKDRRQDTHFTVTATLLSITVLFGRRF